MKSKMEYKKSEAGIAARNSSMKAGMKEGRKTKAER
jgi:hypothetical protein